MNVPDSLFAASGPGVHQLFEAQAIRAPGNIALTLGGESLTYAGLAARSQAIARRLRARGIGRGDLVGVFLDRSFDLIASFLGILQVGAAYVPLDTGYPAERLAFMAGDTGMKLIISSEALAVRLPAGAAPVLALDHVDLEPETPDIGAIPAKAIPASDEHLAYVMYTSGSTGMPKGVAIPHRGIVRLVQEPDYVCISPADVFLQVSPVSFDASTFEIWGALTNGARLVLMPPGQPSLEQIGEVIQREHVSVLWLTAGLFNLMVDERLPDLMPVRQLLAGGDVLSVPHIRRALAGLPDTQIINGYGPTENTTFTCCHAIPRDFPAGSSVPIGRVIRGTTVHVVDENLMEVADGEEGELVAGGLGLALGYWNRPELTAERFVPAAFSTDPWTRFYRTGDQVRRRADGLLEFLGRKDNQVKLRGFRIELGEIESALRRHPEVRDCAITVWSDSLANRSLAAWVVPREKQKPSREDLRVYAATCLPEHMVPAFWTWLDELPLNQNGKVDRARLRNPGEQGEGLRREPPRNDLERLLVELWRELLGGRPVGVTESYFELGANSLLVAQAHERLRHQHGFLCQLTDLFQFPTVRSLAGHLQELQSPSARPAAASISRAQQRTEALHRFKKR